MPECVSAAGALRGYFTVLFADGEEVIAKSIATMQVNAQGLIVRYFAARLPDAEGWSRPTAGRKD